jgi:very-short-patch-repair endonuclease
LQWGVVAAFQLLELGLDHSAIRRRVMAGHLHRVHRGVYAVGHRRLTGDGHWMAGVLACGPGAVLSHQCAGARWDILRSSSALVHITAPWRSRHGIERIRVHRVRRLDPQDVTVRAGIPVTTVARTLLDLAAVLNARRLDRAIEDAERQRVYDDRAVNDVLRRCRGNSGRRPLIAALERFAGPPELTRSELERDLLDACRAAGLPMPAVNTWLLGYEVDMLWLEQRVVVELDTYDFHGTRAAFERDRARDAVLEAAGFRVVRVTGRMMRAGGVAELLRALIAQPAAIPG